METEVFINIDRELVDLLYVEEKFQVAITCLKNAVIGSNRQKTAVIVQGIVPKLLKIICDETVDLEVRLDATIIIGK